MERARQVAECLDRLEAAGQLRRRLTEAQQCQIDEYLGGIGSCGYVGALYGKLDRAESAVTEDLMTQAAFQQRYGERWQDAITDEAERASETTAADFVALVERLIVRQREAA